MAAEKDRTKIRLLRLLRAIVERPFGYTKRQLAELYGVSMDTIKHDFESIRVAGFVLTCDKNYRYGFELDTGYKALKDLLHFSEEEQILLEDAIDHISPNSNVGRMLKRKLGTLYDYKRLGYAYLRRPYLTKVDCLLQAEKDKKQVLLEDYPSGHSNKISDRLVEVFHISPPEDMIHAWDLDRQALRHFRISRIKRVRVQDKPWENEGRHIVLPTDPFRIVNHQQLLVHLRLGVGARNELIEHYPITKGYLEETEDPEIFDFQCMVNHEFLGLANFILGNYHSSIEVIEPISLIKHLKEQVEKMKF